MRSTASWSTSIYASGGACTYLSYKQATYTGEGTAANPILLEGTLPSPVKILSGPIIPPFTIMVASSNDENRCS